MTTDRRKFLRTSLGGAVGFWRAVRRSGGGLSGLRQRAVKETSAAADRIVRGLLEGVEPVPAMGAAVMVAQEKGAAYVALG